jgi:hypothetical protein
MGGEVRVKAAYGIYVHEGTRPHEIRPVIAKALANRRTGQFFGKLVHHPGTKAQPFLRDAVAQSEKTVQSFFTDAVKNAIR